MFATDEGYIDDEVLSPVAIMAPRSVQEREGARHLLCAGRATLHYTPLSPSVSVELAYRLLASLPRSSLAVLQSRIAPLLKLDIVGVSS